MLSRVLSAILIIAWITPSVEAQRLRHGRGNYYLHVPPNLEKPSLLVWLHPAAGGAKPEYDFWRKQSAAFGDGGNSILLAPEAIEGAWSVRADEPFIKAVVRKIIGKYDVDPEKVILGGHSAGAAFTYELGLRNQDLFHALFPNAGRLAIRKPPLPAPDGSPLIYVFHSENDTVIPFSEAERTRDVLREAGYPVSFYSDNIGHNIGGPTLNLYAAIDRLIQKVEPRIVRLFGGLEGIKVLAQPESAEIFKVKKASVDTGSLASPVTEDNLVAQPTQIVDTSLARFLSALVDARAYSVASLPVAGSGPFEAFRVKGQTGQLEVLLGSEGGWMTVYLDARLVGAATLDEGAKSELHELARGLLPAG